MSERPRAPRKDEAIPEFASIKEALDFYLDRFPKLELTQQMLGELRQCIVFQKAGLTVDVSTDGTLAKAAAESAYLTGQLWLIEQLISRGHIVTAG